MTRAVFERLKTEALIEYLITQDLELEEEDIAIFKKKRITGDSLLGLSQDSLERAGLTWVLQQAF